MALFCSDLVERLYTRAREMLQEAEERVHQQGHPALAKLINDTTALIHARLTPGPSCAWDSIEPVLK